MPYLPKTYLFLCGLGDVFEGAKESGLSPLRADFARLTPHLDCNGALVRSVPYLLLRTCDGGAPLWHGCEPRKQNAVHRWRNSSAGWTTRILRMAYRNLQETLVTPPNKIIGPNVGGPRLFSIRTSLAARVGQFWRYSSAS